LTPHQVFRHLIIRHFFVIRHSGFVIFEQQITESE